MSTLADRIDSILDQSTPEHSRTSAGSRSPWRALSPASGPANWKRSPSPALPDSDEEDDQLGLGGEQDFELEQDERID